MRVILDSSRCQGHGRCYGLAPDLFEADEEGYAVLRLTGTIDPALESEAQSASDNCPEYAISVES